MVFIIRMMVICDTLQHWRVKPDEGKNLITFALAQVQVQDDSWSWWWQPEIDVFLCVYQSSLKGWQHGRDDADDHDIVAGTDTDADHEDFPHLHLCCKQEKVPLYKQLILHISLPYPGVLRHTYEGAVMMTQQKTCIFHLIKYFSDFQKQLSAAKPSIVHNFTNFCSVPKRAPDRGLPHNWLNGWSFADHLLPRHARGKSQRGPGIVDNGNGDAMELNSCYI